MKKLITVTAILGLLASPLASHAGEWCPTPCKQPVSCSKDPTAYIFAYGGGSTGGNFNNIFLGAPFAGFETGDGFIMGAGVGVKTCFLGGSRFEIEQLHSELPFERAFGIPVAGDLNYTGTFVNYLKEIPVGCMTAYLGGGFGYASVEATPNIGGAVVTHTDSALAYQLIAGLDIPVSDCFDLFVQYKFIGVGETRSAIGDINDFETHNVVFGVRFSF